MSIYFGDEDKKSAMINNQFFTSYDYPIASPIFKSCVRVKWIRVIFLYTQFFHHKVTQTINTIKIKSSVISNYAIMAQRRTLYFSLIARVIIALYSIQL